jgi:serine O-acetyltransferase
MASQLWRELRSDMTRITGRCSGLSLIVSALARRCHRPLVSLRLAQAVARTPWLRWALPLFIGLHQLARQLGGMDLPWRVKLGEGARIDHGWGLVVNAGVEIGRNVTLFHGVTLGQADRIAADGSRRTHYPVIEDEVWIGPHAVIVGKVRVGRGSRVLAGAFITEDVPPYSLVGGNPAQVMRSDVKPDVAHPWAADLPDTASREAAAAALPGSLPEQTS